MGTVYTDLPQWSFVEISHVMGICVFLLPKSCILMLSITRHTKFLGLPTSILESEKNCFSTIALSSDGDGIMTDGRNAVDAVKAEAEAGCEFKVHGSLMHMMALTSVIGRPIYSVYPNMAFRYRVLMQNLLKSFLVSA